MDSPLGSLVGWPGDQLTTLVRRLAAQGLTVACAESLTGGLLCAVLTEIPGVSAVLRGGLVVYATDLKGSLAGVDPDLLATRGPVDPEVAAQLADGARRACGATIGIGLTGVAGPDPQNGVPVGTWHVALAGPGGTAQRSGHPSGGRPTRGAVRVAAVRAALDLLAELTSAPGATAAP
ncbi:nicotinamide-nucleotide amidase [Nakamurella panacisegetis]|uniref:Nicotinamide-nucleotide amidase n=1 Tax=Nakamurella panacisegetis TaxID=1090615 RepID=A0A1H0S009_9ACTN|nr:CinA family protein [Nakamurella panacisegetis]SDP34965.1 nicotinamide-nucleotide amidase [Nakamurella panacisegetis]